MSSWIDFKRRLLRERGAHVTTLALHSLSARGHTAAHWMALLPPGRLEAVHLECGAMLLPPAVDALKRITAVHSLR